MSKGYSTKDSGERISYSSGMNRDIQDNKPRYDLCYEPLLTEWANLMARGAKKYGENNWQLANSEEELNRFKASAFRHFMQFLRGEDDEAHHAAICFNVAAIMMLRDKLALENNERIPGECRQKGCIHTLRNHQTAYCDLHGDW